MRQAVRNSPELARVLALPRRTWADNAGDLAVQVTDLLRTSAPCRTCGEYREHHSACPDKSRTPIALRPLQAVSLKESCEQQGFLGPIGVGKGKTLISLLLPYVLESQRPMLVLPAGLIGKTRREWQGLAVHWRIPNWIRIESYELLGRVQAKDTLDQFMPDLIVFDEVQKVKNRKAAVTRRFERYIRARREIESGARSNLPMAWIPPRLRVCGMSGTITRKSLKDFAHILQWCLPHVSPVPWTWVELEQWALALDELVNPISRLDPGALLRLCDERENDAPDATTAARRGFQRRLAETPGIVATSDSSVGASILIEPVEEVRSLAIDDAFDRLRGNDAKKYKGWELPDGWQLIDGAAVWRHARELVLGFYYVWDPRPPAEWLLARQLWAWFARGIIKRGLHDSEHEVALNAHRYSCTVDEALGARELPPHRDPEIGRREVFDHWRALRDTFEKNQVPVWICDSVLKMCVEWMYKHPRGIVWTEHVAFGERLSEVSGFPYFGQKGLDRTGRMIEQASGPVIASFDANREGRNLQHNWSDNFYVSCPSDGAELEQGIGRTHRDGQPEDTVTVDVYLGCIEHVAAFETARSRARYIQDTTGNEQKLCYADVTLPSVSDVAARPGSRWQKGRS